MRSRALHCLFLLTWAQKECPSSMSWGEEKGNIPVFFFTIVSKWTERSEGYEHSQLSHSNKWFSYTFRKLGKVSASSSLGWTWQRPFVFIICVLPYIFHWSTLSVSRDANCVNISVIHKTVDVIDEIWIEGQSVGEYDFWERRWQVGNRTRLHWACFA